MAVQRSSITRNNRLRSSQLANRQLMDDYDKDAYNKIQLHYENKGPVPEIDRPYRDILNNYSVYDYHPEDTDEYIDKRDTNDYDEFVKNRRRMSVDFYSGMHTESDTGKDIVNTLRVDTFDDNRTSRYGNLKRLINRNNEQYIETYDRKNISVSADDTYHIVTLKDVNRLDLISFQYYRTPLLWWVIAEASDLIDPFDVPLHSVLRIPKLNNIYGYGGILK